MRKAVNYLACENVQFIATNKDMRVPTANGVITPGMHASWLMFAFRSASFEREVTLDW